MGASCRSCGAPVVWVETLANEKRAGRKMPLDADPENPRKAARFADGNIIAHRVGGEAQRSGDGTYLVRYLPKDAGRPPNGAFRSHFSTCPNAAKHRRK